MIGVRLPSGRVVQVNTDDPKAAVAAARKFVAGNSYEKARVNAQTGPLGTIGGAVETVARAIPGVSELQAVLPTILGRGGPDFGSAWNNNRAVQQGYVDQFHADHPVISALTTGAANAAPIAAAIMTGGASEAPAAAEGISGLLQGSARRATAGAGAGAVYGASQPGSLKERLNAADAGAVVGGVVGAVAPSALSAGGNAVSAAKNTVVRAANRATGGAILDDAATAQQRIVQALKADGATPEALKDALNGFLKNGATDPTLLDVASRLPSGGQNTMALIRGAAVKGSGRGVAAKYGDQVAADLQDKAIAATNKLTPNTQPANLVRSAAEAARGKAADAEYRAPYGTTVDAGPVLPALEGDAGRVGINGAYKDADALRLSDQMDELGKLRAAAGPEEAPVARIGGDVLPASPKLSAALKDALGWDDGQVPVSIGTLDRIKIALNDAGQAAARAGENSRAAGYFQRAGEIDDHLASNNGDYAAARDNYARASAGIDALDHGATGVNATPDEFAATLEDLRAKGAQGLDDGLAEASRRAVQDMAGVGYRGAITDRIGSPPEGATGVLNRLATSTNQGRNLSEVFDPETAQAYRDGLQDLIDQMNNARFISPNGGSQTAGRLADLGLVEPADITVPHLTPTRVLLGAVNKIRNGAALTDSEKKLIAQMGTTPASLDELPHVDVTKLIPSQLLQDMQAYIAGAGVGDAQKDPNSQ